VNTNTTEHRLLVYNGTFAVLDRSGDINGTPGTTTPDGLFARDARHLSRWQLTADGAVPVVLVPASQTAPVTVLTPQSARGEPPAYTIFREQAVVDGALTERVRLTSNLGETTTTRLALTADADFADQFELRGDHRLYDKPHSVRSRERRPYGVEFGYRRGEWRARTTVTAEPAPDAVEETGGSARQLSWLLTLPPHGTAELRLRVEALPHGATPERSAPDDDGSADPAGVLTRLSAETGDFVRAEPSPSQHTDWPELANACEQGLTDLAGLRVTAPGPDGERLRIPGAGVPWYLTLFGRDSLLTSLFALPYRPRLAEHTLLALAATQAREEDRGRLAQPGKIVHEIRHGELAHFGQVPYGRYYGSVDSTPLFLILLSAYAEAVPGDGMPRDGMPREAVWDTGRPGSSGGGSEAATGLSGPELARRLEPQARAAADWMFEWGGLETHGYLAYQAHEGGLANQNWKDSPGAICAADGSRPAGAVMVAEVQGYAYDALCRTAELARTHWGDSSYADRLDKAASALRERFAADFWQPDAGFPLLALDDGGHRSDVLASDAGHLLWSGILGQNMGETVGQRLLEEDFFSGWGVRTLAEGQRPYHPLSYHRGSVWPQDNALIALGLARYGLHDQVRTLTHGMIDAAARHGYRLPEVMAGYSRGDHPDPVPYPHACSPQAWAAATPLALLTATGGRP
jgi:glycogen debranching enzyme